MTEEEIERLQYEIDRQSYLVEVGKKAQEKFYISLLQRKFTLMCQQGIAPPLIQQEYNKVKELETAVAKSNNTEVYGYFICCNPDEMKITLSEFERCCSKSVTKVWIETYLWVIEQRGKTFDDVGKGFHTHILITAKAGKKYCQIVREFASSFKKATDTSQYQWFSVKPLTEEEYVRKIRYCAGYKADDDKIIKQRFDVVFRERNNIKKCYTSDEFDFRGQYVEIEPPESI